MPTSDGFSTGDIRAFPVAVDRWVLLANHCAIGNSNSRAAARANGDTRSLFMMLWQNYSDEKCPVSGGRGVSALSDFAAGKMITLPRLGLPDAPEGHHWWMKL